MRPQFKLKPTNKTAIENRPVMFDCMAIGDPQPVIKWDRNEVHNDFDFERFKVSCFLLFIICLEYMLESIFI